MILLHVISQDEQQAIEIADLLVEEKLILNAVAVEKVAVRQKGESGKLETIHQTLILGKTKALLFNIIDEKLREIYKDNMPVLYSVPIVNMDWEQANELVSKTAKV